MVGLKQTNIELILWPIKIVIRNDILRNKQCFLKVYFSSSFKNCGMETVDQIQYILYLQTKIEAC